MDLTKPPFKIWHSVPHTGPRSFSCAGMEASHMKGPTNWYSEVSPGEVVAKKTKSRPKRAFHNLQH